MCSHCPESFTETYDPARHGSDLAAHAQKYTRETSLSGSSPDAPITVTPGGGRHSLVEADYTQLDGPAIAKIAEVMYHGSAKYGRDNWRAISDRDHINHALMHLFADQAGDIQDEHLAHALTRLMFAMAVRLRPGFLGEFAEQPAA